jgi:hypothetical protein
MKGRQFCKVPFSELIHLKQVAGHVSDYYFGAVENVGDVSLSVSLQVQKYKSERKISWYNVNASEDIGE